MIDVRYGIFCEFARQEVGGKSTLIGTFGHACRFSGKPPFVQPNLALHIYLVDTEGETTRGRLSVSLPGSSDLLEYGVVISPGSETNQATGRSLNVTFPPLVFEKAGPLRATLSLASIPPVVAEFTLEIQADDLEEVGHRAEHADTGKSPGQGPQAG